MAAVDLRERFFIEVSCKKTIREIEVTDESVAKAYSRFKLSEDEKATLKAIKRNPVKIYVRTFIHTKEFQTEFIPNDRMMQLLKNHYELKLKLPINLCALSQIGALAKKSINSGENSFSIIILPQSNFHVTPLYFHYNIPNRKWYLFVLDSVASVALNSRINNRRLGIENLQIVYSLGTRQVDSNSCRMGAFQTIKWCHRHLKTVKDVTKTLDMMSVSTPKEVMRFEGASREVTALRVPSIWVPHAQRRCDLDLRFDSNKMASKSPITVIEYMKAKCLKVVDRTLMLTVLGKGFVIHDETPLNMRLANKAQKWALK